MDNETASEKLADLDREIGALVHAINNPMTVITGNAQLLLELAKSGELDPLVEGAVTDIEAAAQTLSELMDKLARFRKELEAELQGMDIISGS
ncbi:MAG: histidine kinase dimerization/phospho-acceptor domain-containing protein [Rubricoccaceae bacterium]|nr:histidine kinase dimerization/phospho-acceptor domain-containing protein [Rubricoccaceae bacterium]